MAKIAATDFTVTIVSRGYMGRDKIRRASLTFGGAGLEYTTNGIPMPVAGTYGIYVIKGLYLVSPVDGYVYKYDVTNNKLLIFEPAAHAHSLVFKANAAANAVTMAANSLRNASAGDLTVVGGGADGGIANSTTVPMAQVADTHAPAAQTHYAIIIGR